MNIIFLCQGYTLSLFYDLMKVMKNKHPIYKVGFYIADRLFYDKFKKKNPEIFSGGIEVLKEWEIIKKAKNMNTDFEKINKYEEKLGDPFLWNPIVADRRIYYGRKATFEQDYRSRFQHQDVISILTVGIEEMEGFFNRVKPDIVINFICVTFGEYLAYLIAKSRNIKFLNLRPSRIKNYFYGGESIFEPSEVIKKEYENMIEKGISEELKRNAISFLTTVRKTHAMYEGVLPAEHLFVRGIKKIFLKNESIFNKIKESFINLSRRLYKYRDYRYDTHFSGIIYPTWFNRIIKPFRIKKNEVILRKYYINLNELTSFKYAFFPLHKEPEVTLLVYGKPYLNQIEVIRNIARSLPIEWKLLVKEHPAAIGYRSVNYYKKLLSIPNVLLVKPEITSREILQNASLVFIISGSVGLEGLILQKPVIHLGKVPFSILPDTMIRHVKDLDNLAIVVQDILKTHKHDEEALIAYIAAIIKNSVPINFYSEMLRKKGVYKFEEGDISNSIRAEHINRLADYILKIFYQRGI